MTLTISVRRIRQFLLIIAVFFTLLSLTARLLQPGTGGIARLFDVNAEMSYPNWYSSLILAASCLLLAAIAGVLMRLQRMEFIVHWIFLSATFALLSSDEIVGLHESMSTVMRRLGNFTGFLRFAWVVPAGVGVFAFGLAYLRFLAALPVRRRNQFVVAGFIYVLGALGMEMIGAKQMDLYSRSSTAYISSYHLEELLELCGVALFNAALIEHLAGLLGPDGLRLRFSTE